MRVPIRTISPQDADILGRTILTRTVSNGCVEAYALHWRSDALKTWELEQRARGEKPIVSVRVDELDLSVVYVELMDARRTVVKALSTKRKYTSNLSLYEHDKLKKALKKENLKDTLIAMSDEESFNLRLKYYAALGRANDPIAYRRLVELRDQLAALREEDVDPVNEPITRPISEIIPKQKEKTPKNSSPKKPPRPPKSSDSGDRPELNAPPEKPVSVEITEQRDHESLEINKVLKIKRMKK
ncbi:hypothetical protein [Uliginosibacterium sp. 31-12]|uniref:hypothetical protein n=1 Tax=Uliginosibacterium sp. 31-12 TaxID=3062781 RepID=UPI0026E40624|nr:hypothetical protein [Uliginosibacterium sp. 31-12]MDO6386422.1 hypothetical protein [Uliginosibacterium sp. 31-12]